MKTFERIQGKKVSTKNTQPSKTDQSFAKYVNVNTIMAKYIKTGQVHHLAKNRGVYQDMTKIPDYRTALQTVIEANSAFDTLPSNIRNRFQNDPAQFIEFLQDSKNVEEAVKLGILTTTIPTTKTPNPETTPKTTKKAQDTNDND